MKGNSPLDLSRTLQKRQLEDRNRLQEMFDGQRRNFEMHVREGVNEILQDIDRELQRTRKPFRKLQLRSWFIAMTAAGLAVILQLAIGNIQLNRVWMQDSIWSLVRNGVVEISRDQEGNRWLQMNRNWQPDRNWTWQDKDGRWYVRVE